MPDGVEIADLDNGTLVHVAVDPGRRTLHSDEVNDATGLQVEAGKQYFYSKVKRGKDIRRPDMVVDAPR